LKNVFVIYPEHSLIIETFYGPVNMEIFMELVEELWDDPAYDRSMDVIVDLSRAKMAMSPAQLDEFAGKFIHSERSLIGRAAILASKPLETAISLLLRDKMKVHQPIAVFATMEAALGFLDKEITLGSGL
jgi:hypothetical protein